jgi:hypothetical protein
MIYLFAVLAGLLKKENFAENVMPGYFNTSYFFILVPYKLLMMLNAHAF